MTSDRRTALVAGVLYLLTFVSIPRLALFGPVLTDPDFILSPGSDTGVLVGVLLELIVGIAIVGTGVALYPVLKRQNESVALGFVAARLFETGVIAVGIISLLSILTLRQDGAAPGADAASLVTTGQSLVAIQNWTFLIGQGLMPGINAVLLVSAWSVIATLPIFLWELTLGIWLVVKGFHTSAIATSRLGCCFPPRKRGRVH